MKLNELLANVEVLEIIGSKKIPDIMNIACDTDKVTDKTLFISIKGQNTDSHELAEQAASRGAVAFIVERRLPIKQTQILVKNSRSAMSYISSNFYGNPVKSMRIISVTGTNGKTTTSHIIASILRAAGKKTGIIGTSGILTEKARLGSSLTTPDPIDLHAAFATMKEAGCEYVVMEASAHAIHFNKLDGILAEVGVFTNLTQDHLDFFGDMESYSSAKERFFSSKYIKRAVINADCPYGMRIATETSLPVITYGFNNPSDVFCVNYTVGEKGISFLLNLMDRLYDIRSRLHGRYNMYNIMAAATACSLMYIPLETIAKGIEEMDAPEGRHNVIKLNDFSAVVDYAHTPDGIKNILSSIREYAKGRIICVFGCGGNRDRAKRPIMGRQAALYSDYCVITSDNPRQENPDSIIDEIVGGFSGTETPFERMSDRHEAIFHALDIAKENDVVAILGKGDETTQEIMDERLPFDDREVVREWRDGKNK